MKRFVILSSILVLLSILCFSMALAEGATLTLPQGLRVVEDEAFMGDFSVREVIVPDSVTHIGTRAFAGSGIERINIPASLNDIADDAFNGCAHVTLIGYKNGLAYSYSLSHENIDFEMLPHEHAWDRGTILAMPTLESEGSKQYTCTICGETRTEPIVIANSGDFTFTIENGEYIITKYLGTATHLVISSVYDGKNVVSIRDSAFEGNTRLVEVYTPETLTSIGSYAFRRCTSLKHIELPEGLHELSDEVFSGCTSLQSIILPEGLTSIKDGVFMGCTALERINIPSAITYMGNKVFSGCTNLSNVRIDEGAQDLGNYTFENCSILKTVTIPMSVNNSKMSFSDSGLESVIFTTSEHNSVIPGGLLYNCKKLTSVTIPEGVTEIGRSIPYSSVDYRGTFKECADLRQITLPSTMTKIGNNAFESCTALETVLFGNSIQLIDDYAFNGCTSLQSIVLPEGLTRIKDGAFMGCTALRSITIPSSVTSIADNAFNGCTALTIICDAGSYAEQYAIAHNADWIDTGIMVAPTITSITQTGDGIVRLTWSSQGTTNYFAIFEPNPFGEDVLKATVQGNEAELVGISAGGHYYYIRPCSSLGSDAIYGEKSSSKEIIVWAFTINRTEIDLVEGQCFQLNQDSFFWYTIQTIDWSSSDESIATVDSTGLVTAVDLGDVCITAMATTAEGMVFTATCMVTVTPQVFATSVTMAKAEVVIDYHEGVFLVATVSPSDATNKELEWSSSDESVATVDSDGYVWGVDEGIAIITARTVDGSNLSDSCTVKVSEMGQVTYRALLISESTFKDNRLDRAVINEQETKFKGAAAKIESMLHRVKGAEGGEWTVTNKDNKYKDDIRDLIQSELTDKADGNDVSLFYIGTHGNSESQGAGAGRLLMCSQSGELSLEISFDELGQWLEAVPGKVIILIDSCGSGAAIYPGNETGALRKPNKFYVLTASAYQQDSYGHGSNTWFAIWLTEGVGKSGDMPADTYSAYPDTVDGTVDLFELYSYISNMGDDYEITVNGGTYTQQVQVYPANTRFPLFK